MAAPPMEKDVSDQLLRQRKVRRKLGEIPYPLEYTSEMLNFDIWDHMFLVSCCRKLTMHQFASPPSMVLDLGCGGGYWAIEAARQWLGSTIIGYDLKAIQPRLSRLPSHHDLARRVKWVHGNLLDGLPFPPAHFDFVRIVGLGLGVPEDEWQFVLEDITRIMKPGAVLEIIEEDLIFPCGRPPRPRLPPISIDSLAGNSITPSPYSARSSSTLLSDPWSNQDDYHSDGPIRKQTSLSTLHESPISISPRSPLSAHPSFTLPPPDEPPPPDGAPHPQDHTRLKVAWEAMLSRRFLSSQLITVLPFYLSSSEFVDIQTHPSLQIPLPPNSQSFLQRKSGLVRSSTSESLNSHGDLFDPDHTFELQPSSKRRSGEGENSSGPHPVKLSQRTIPSWAPMHLARTVSTIIGCKEAIWREYDDLYRNDTSAPPVLKTVRKKHSLTSPDGVPSPYLETIRPSAREGFEAAWSNWENDMKDRIGMRGRIISECGWPEPDGDRPDWRVWRDNLENKTTHRVPSVMSSLDETPDLCRSLRGFVAWKPSTP